MTIDRAVTLIVSAVLTWAATYFLGTAPAQQQAAHAETRWAHWKEKNAEKRGTIADLEQALAEARAYCAGVEDAP